MATLVPNMQIVEVPGQISGPAVISDLCGRIAAKLEHSCDLRATDCYRAYAAKVIVELQLHDVYPVEVAAQVTVGEIDPAQPVQRIALGSDVQGSQTASDSLEKPIDESGFEPQARDSSGRFVRK